jgi:hypothetical protein
MKYKNVILQLERAIYKNNIKTINDRSKRMQKSCEEFADSIFEIHYQLWHEHKIKPENWFTGAFEYSPFNPNNPLND